MQTGVGRLLNKEVYKAAYPLHDGEYSYTEFAKDDPRRTSNIRQVRFFYYISKTISRIKNWLIIGYIKSFYNLQHFISLN